MRLDGERIPQRHWRYNGRTRTLGVEFRTARGTLVVSRCASHPD